MRVRAHGQAGGGVRALEGEAPKYSSIEKFMKLPFQRVVIHFKRSPNEGVMPVSLLVLRAVQKFLECTTFNVLAIPACRNLRLN